MQRLIRFRIREPHVSDLFFGENKILLPIISYPFILGILFGAVAGLFTDSVSDALCSTPFFSETAATGQLLPSLWRSFRYLILSAVFSTSCLGIVLIPALAAFRSFIFTCAISAIFSSSGLTGLLHSALSIGVPMLIGTPAFLLSCCCGVRAAGLLLPTHDQMQRFGSVRIFRFRYFILIMILALAGALYEFSLLPHFTRLLS